MGKRLSCTEELNSFAAEQIPGGRAANALGVVRNSMTADAAFKAAALWEKADERTVSIPTAIASATRHNLVRLAP